MYRLYRKMTIHSHISIVSQCGESTRSNDKVHGVCFYFKLRTRQDILEYLFLFQREYVQIKCKVRGKPCSFWWCKRFSEISSDSRVHSVTLFFFFFFFLSKFMDIGPVALIETKSIFRIFSRIEPNLRIALIPPEKKTWFSAYFVLYLNKVH